MAPERPQRKICVVTGTRAEYGLLVPIMRRIQASPLLQLQVVAAGMHLSPEFGHTVDLIRRDGFPVHAEVDMLFSSDRQTAMAKGVGIGIYGMAQAFEMLNPDIVLVLGDRVEVFAAAAAASLSARIVAHVHGGDRGAGGLDEYMRHAVTKLAHLHFTATEASRDRVLRLGERVEYVWLVGAPSLDDLGQVASLDRSGLSDFLGFALPPRFALVVHHPISTFPERAAKEIRIVLEAMQQLDLPVIALGPNSDAGGRSLAEELRRRDASGAIRLVVNLPRDVFLSLMRHAVVLVGNTSSGLIEGAGLRVPYVLVGERQQGRERAENVIEVECEVDAIVQAVKTVEGEAFQERLASLRNPYGDGHASERIVKVLEELTIGPEVRKKVLSY